MHVVIVVMSAQVMSQVMHQVIVGWVTTQQHPLWMSWVMAWGCSRRAVHLGPLAVGLASPVGLVAVGVAAAVGWGAVSSAACSAVSS